MRIDGMESPGTDEAAVIPVTELAPDHSIQMIEVLAREGSAGELVRLEQRGEDDAAHADAPERIEAPRRGWQTIAVVEEIAR